MGRSKRIDQRFQNDELYHGFVNIIFRAALGLLSFAL